MTEAYLGERRLVVTKIQVPTLRVTQIKTKDTDGYNAIQVSFGNGKKHPTRALRGHFKKLAVPKYAREIRQQRIQGDREFKIGDTISLEQALEVGDILSIQGVTKGKGFTGVIKRWGFACGPRTHGQSDRTRAPGSIGQGTTPGRVHKGKKMAGRHGSLTRSVKDAQIIHIDIEKGEIWVTGHAPGHTNGLLALTIIGHQDLKDKPLSPEIIEPAKEEKQETAEEEEKKTKEAPKDKPDEKQENPASKTKKNQSKSDDPTLSGSAKDKDKKGEGDKQ